jgi:hypothetical protein
MLSVLIRGPNMVVFDLIFKTQTVKFKYKEKDRFNGSSRGAGS